MLTLAVGVAPATELPPNVGLGLRQLAAGQGRNLPRFGAKNTRTERLQMREDGRVVVNIHLNGAKPATEVATALRALGVEVLHVDTHWRKGIVSARLSIEQAATAAVVPGVKSVLLAPKPRARVGAVTAQSSVVNRADKVNAAGAFTAAGLKGTGIGVGIISDSFDAAPGVPRASVGVASGDLPGTGNPNGYTHPVVVIDDNFAPNGGQTDEGRAMAEIVHDIAPGARLAFSTVQETQAIMAYSIRNLRADKTANCDIIVDDIGFADEPYFSDGLLSQAIEDVVNGSTLPGKKVVYFAAAGNESNYGYSSSLRHLSKTQGLAANDAAAGPQIPLDFSDVPPALYAGGFHNVNTSGPAAIAMPLTTDGLPFVFFQWDDPFDAGAITTDYNILVFDETGAYIPFYSGTDNNVATDEPIEVALVDVGSTFYVVITLATPAPPPVGGPVAKQLRFISFFGESLEGPYISYESTAMSGHTTAASANAVAAYVYNSAPERDPTYNAGEQNPPPGPYRPAVEDFTSNGGMLAFYFNAEGQRLTTPEIRFKPDMAAADAVDTTFFGFDYDNNTFPNFFGTSAAAPTAAGVAALLLEAAGGPGSLTPAQVRTKLQETARPHDLDPFRSTAVGVKGTASVTIQTHGNSTAASATDPNFFTVTFTGAPGQSLAQLSIDLTNAGLIFDEDPVFGFPFTVGSNPNGIVVAPSLSGDGRVLTLTFANFLPGYTFTFGLDRDYEGSGAGGNSADLLAGAEFRAVTNSFEGIFGGFGNQLGQGWTFVDGHGLVDALKAVESVRGPLPPLMGVPLNVSTRAFVGTGDNVLIGGFIAQGGSSKRVILRGLGPTLTGAGVPMALADPVLELRDQDGTVIAINDNWQTDSGAAELQAAGFAPGNPAESALLRTLPVGRYTAVLSGAGATSGNALFEAYDFDAPPAASRLANLSSRARVGTGSNVTIGGFILGNSDPSRIVVRALGPSLAAFGVSDVLSDPELSLHDADGNVLSSNDNWQQDSLQAVELQAAGLAPSDPLESGLSLTLPPGSYTAVLRGYTDMTGVSLLEVYNVR